MKRIITLSLIIGLSLNVLAQRKDSADIEKKIEQQDYKIFTLQTENIRLKSKIADLSVDISRLSSKIDSIQNDVESNRNAISKTSNELDTKIATNKDNANSQISAVGQSLNNKSLYGIIGILVAIIISLILYWFLSKRQKDDKTDVIQQLTKTKTSIEENLIKEFGKQTDLMEMQLKMLEAQKNNIQISNKEVDHSLALKLADEITLMERNITHMDAGTKGLKQLLRSISKLKDYLSANGYELPELLGKPFNQGMRVIPINTISDENLEVGQEIISKIIKPQVNYNDKIIQTAQVEISTGC